MPCSKCTTSLVPCIDCLDESYCEACKKCSNSFCRSNKEVWERNIVFDFGFGTKIEETTSTLPEYDEDQTRSLLDIFWKLEQPVGKPIVSSRTTTTTVVVDRKRKIEGNEEEDKKLIHVKKQRVSRNGEHLTDGNSINTIGTPPLDIGVATWNINHFNKGEEKIKAIYWLFRNQQWLDVLLLQEINDTGKKQLDKIAKQLHDLGLAVAYGPLMRSASQGKAPKYPDETPTEASIQLCGKTYSIRTHSEYKNFELKIDGEWRWIKVGQPEYYPIIYRKNAIEVVKTWATNDGTELEDGTLYWAKGWYSEALFTTEEKVHTTLARKQMSKELTSLFEEKNCTIDMPSFGRSSSSRKAPFWKRYPITSSDDVQYELYCYFDDSKKTQYTKCEAYRLHWIVPMEYRPIIVHDVKVRGDRIAHLGIVHTSPAGQGLNRKGEFRQVEAVMKHMKEEGAKDELWILAGDYYLDPEAKVGTITTTDDEETDEANEEAEREAALTSKFIEAVEKSELEIVIPLSATNQSVVQRKFDEFHYVMPETYPKLEKAQTEFKQRTKEKKRLNSRVLRLVELDKRILVVNKRADFFLATKTFRFHQCGLLAPTGGLLRIDPKHNALDWWSGISDHCPVGAMLSSAKKPARARHYTEHEPKDFEERMESAWKQLGELHREAVYEISRILGDLLTAMSFGLEPAALAAKLCLFLDCVLSDSYVQQFEPKRRSFDAESYAEISKNISGETVRGFLQQMVALSGDEVFKTDYDLTLVAVAREVYPFLAVLGYTTGDFDLTSEKETYEDVKFESFEDF